MSQPNRHSSDLCFTSAVELAKLLRRRELSPVDLLKTVLERVDRIQPRINCFVTVCHEQALAAAKAAEEILMRTSADKLPLLFGLPVSVKDLEDTAGVRTTYGSRHFADHVPDHDALIWARLKAHGAILLGKTTTPEFGMHSVTESLLTGTTKNPWDLGRTTGGSSGGAAAAVSAGLGPLATGSDGGGSIRVPSSFCGIVGLKASPGRIPFGGRNGAWEGVCVTGPMTRTVADCALMLDATAGPDSHDGIFLPAAGESYLAGLEQASVRGLRIGYCADLRSGPVDPEVSRVVAAAVARFETDLGAHVEPVELSLPDVFDYFVNWWGPSIVLFHDKVLKPLGHPEYLPANLRWALERGAKVNLRDYVRTQYETRTELHNAFADVFSRYDLLVWPTTPCVAFPHPGPAGGPVEIAGQPTREPVLENQRFTEAISHAGYPAISVPAGFTHDGLPVGLQIAAAHGCDRALLQAAAAFEAVAPWAAKRPTC